MNKIERKIFNFAEKEPFKFENGESLSHLKLSYETYGTLSKNKDNAILLFHALTGSHHACGVTTEVKGVRDGLWREECYDGWWNDFIGENKALDTSKYFIICVNYLGGCYGSSGPSSIDEKTKNFYGSKFPMLSSGDIVNSQKLLLDSLGIKKLYAVIGGSLGAMLALQFAVRFASSLSRAILIASGAKVTVLQKIQNLEQIKAIENDKNFLSGDYYNSSLPNSGLALARMISHKTFVSLSVLETRARSEVKEEQKDSKLYQIEDAVESYMLHQGEKFVSRFDANTYIRIVNVWQKYDLLKSENSKTFKELFRRLKNINFLVFSIDSDVCYYPDEQAFLVSSLKEAGVNTKHITVHSEKGHDSFLLESELYSPYIAYILNDKIL